MLFFQLMTRRYEHACTVLTSTKALEEWGDILPVPLQASGSRATHRQANGGGIRRRRRTTEADGRGLGVRSEQCAVFT